MVKIELKNNKYLTFAKGNFDSWCVYEVDENGFKTAPLDIDYFNTLDELSQIFSTDMLYEDFVKIYDKTTSTFDKNVILNSDELFNAKYLSDISFSSNDYTLNSLLSLLPKKIYIHLIDHQIDEFINTLHLIFENRVSLCLNCDICNLYKYNQNPIFNKKNT